MSAKQEILDRVRRSLSDVTVTDPVADVPIAWEFGRPTAVADPITLFVERVEDYRAEVDRVAADGVGEAIVRHLRSAGVASVVLPDGLDAAWASAIEDAGLVVRRDPLTHAELNTTDAVVTASSVGIAETGTIVIDHRADQGRRALTLVPDVHVCVVRCDQIVTDVPEAVARLKASVVEGWPQTGISGPSATSDIELNRVEGVHGPRTLVVIVAG